MISQHWQDYVVLLLGTWLLLSPFVIETGSPASWNAQLVGLALVLLAALALIGPRLWEKWLSLILGVWLVVSPFVLGFTYRGAAAWNAIIIGLLISSMVLLMITRPATRIGSAPRDAIRRADARSRSSSI